MLGFHIFSNSFQQQHRVGQILQPHMRTEFQGQQEVVEWAE